MDNDEVIHETPVVVHDLGHEAHVHHHKETFITKYVFSQDHKMISKQFLITGIIWAMIGGLFSVIFRFQLGYPDQTFPFLEDILGRWGKGGKIDPEFYYALVTMHGTILVFFVLTAGLSGTFSNLLIPLQAGARDMASPFLNMLSYWFFFISSVIMFSSLFVQTGPASGGWTITWRVKLYCYHTKYAYQGNEHDKIAPYNLGIFFHCGIRCIIISCFIIRCCITVVRPSSWYKFLPE
jgi:cytochrome c oxidase subunit I